MSKDMPNIEPDSFRLPELDRLTLPGEPDHAPRVLMLYGSLRGRSYSRFLTLEAKRVLEALGAEVKVFDPAGLPLVSDDAESHPKVLELREVVTLVGSPGLVLAGTARGDDGVMKAQIDWLPLAPIGGVRPDAGPDAGADAGLRRLAELQRRQPDAHSRPLDADDHHPQPVFRPKAFAGV
jgi:arsenic resistance protein ArsH